VSANVNYSLLSIKGIKNPGGDKIFRTKADRLWGPPSLLHNVYRVFIGGQATGA